jgi:hypothetical protein
MKARSLLLLATTTALFVTGCSSYRGPVWVMRVESSPPGARIYSGTSDSYASAEFLGTAPCNATIPAKAGGKIWGTRTIWAVPPVNSPGLYPQSSTFGSMIHRSQLPSSLFFDLAKPPVGKEKATSSSESKPPKE